MYELEVEGRFVDVYAANVNAMLAGFANRTVVASAKLVDLSSEGFGEELWLASVRLASAGET